MTEKTIMSKALESLFAACVALGHKNARFVECQFCDSRGANVRSLVLENVKVEGVDGPLLRTWQDETEVKAMDLKGVGTDIEKGVGAWNADAI